MYDWFKAIQDEMWWMAISGMPCPSWETEDTFMFTMQGIQTKLLPSNCEVSVSADEGIVLIGPGTGRGDSMFKVSGLNGVIEVQLWKRGMRLGHGGDLFVYRMNLVREPLPWRDWNMGLTRLYWSV